jgi:hypothetical protein
VAPTPVELERALLTRDDPALARVYADLLLADGDALGEFAVLHQRGETGLARAWLATHAERLFGVHAPALHHALSELRWSHGFLRGVTISGRLATEPRQLVQGLLALRVARLVTSVSLEDGGADALEAVFRSPLRGQLVHLKLRERDAAALAPLGGEWPALTHLSVRSDDLPAVVELLARSPTLPHLESLALLTGFPSREVVTSLLGTAASFSHLRSLRLSVLSTDPHLPALQQLVPGLFLDEGWLT